MATDIGGVPLSGLEDYKEIEEYNLDKWTVRINGVKYFVKRVSGLHPKMTKEGFLFNRTFKPEDYTNIKDPKKQYRMAVMDALTYAKFYQQLVEDGVYPPTTKFIVCDDGTGDLTNKEEPVSGNPTFLAIMEFLEPMCDGKKIFEKIDGIAGLLNKKYRVSPPSLDVLNIKNYGCSTIDGKVYFYDLHIFPWNFFDKPVIEMPNHLKDKFRPKEVV